MIVPAIDFGQLFLGHIEGTTINFGYLFELNNGIAKTTFANQPTRGFNDISEEEKEIKVGNRNRIRNWNSNLIWGIALDN